MFIDEDGDSLDTSQDDSSLGSDDTSGGDTGQPDIAQHEEVVAEARGWRPKDKYSGDPSKWVDAKTFLDRNSSLQTEVKQLRDRVSQQEEAYADRIRRIEAANERIIREDRERVARELSRAKRAAAELGDVEEFDRVEQEERDYYKRQAEAERIAERPAQRETRPEAPELLPETQEWLRRNTWFHESPAMKQIALGFYEEATEGMPAHRDEPKRLAYVSKKMAEVYPDKFGGGNRSSSVESGSRNIGGAKITSLTAEERAACRKFIARGIIKDEKEYIKYLNEDG